MRIDKILGFIWGVVMQVRLGEGAIRGMAHREGDGNALMASDRNLRSVEDR
jgi:hypothetical protein